MAFDIKKTVDEIVNKAKSDPEFMDKLQKDPEKTIESLTGFDIPDGMADQVLTAVKAKVGAGKLSGILDMFK
ncbi:MAG: hypothetical protein MJZ11_07690 [Lachnospiraceae bacterium]|nr:hypothetical protein [Lachnospiraceae bacterium]